MKALATALVLLLFSLSGATGSEQVICRGPDGHMAIELGWGGACVADPSVAREGEPGVWSNDGGRDRRVALDASCCGSCNDVALVSGETLLRKDGVAPEKPASPHPSGLSFHLPLPDLCVQRPALAARELRVGTTLASIRTIAIRC